MNIRALELRDIDKLKLIWQNHFSHEFDFPDFLNGYHCAFVSEDGNGNIISGGGIKAIAESIIVTDMLRTVKDRRIALCNILQASEYVCKKFNYDQLHCFIQDGEWQKHLEKFGFRPTVGKSLVLNI